MKKTLLTVALVASTIAAFAQGRISIANDTSRLFTLGATGDLVAESHNLTLALYAGTTSGAMTLQTSYALTGANFLAPGRTATKPMTLNGVPGGAPQYFNLVLTDSTDLPTTVDGALLTRNTADTIDLAAAAIIGGTLYGSSGLFQFTPSTSAIAAPQINGTGTTWEVGAIYVNSTTVVPEPSSIALAGIGAVSLLVFRRRK